LAEAGAPDQESEIILGILVPAGTPQGIIDRLHQEIVRVMPDVRDQLAALGFEPIGSTPAQFARRIRSEIDKWAKVIRAAGISAQ
jgi:tripartite-type tricarboxylate transporter receptor subunit TctC